MVPWFPWFLKGTKVSNVVQSSHSMLLKGLSGLNCWGVKGGWGSLT